MSPNPLFSKGLPWKNLAKKSPPYNYPYLPL